MLPQEGALDEGLSGAECASVRGTGKLECLNRK